MLRPTLFILQMLYLNEHDGRDMAARYFAQVHRRKKLDARSRPPLQQRRSHHPLYAPSLGRHVNTPPPQNTTPFTSHAQCARCRIDACSSMAEHQQPTLSVVVWLQKVPNTPLCWRWRWMRRCPNRLGLWQRERKETGGTLVVGGPGLKADPWILKGRWAAGQLKTTKEGSEEPKGLENEKQERKWRWMGPHITKRVMKSEVRLV